MMRSLTLRLALLAGLWVTAGLGAAAWFVTDIAAAQIEAALEARLTGLLDSLAAAAEVDAAGRAAVSGAPAGADFEAPFSGAYWQVTGPDGVAMTSRSLWDQSLPAMPEGREGVSVRRAAGPRGEPLLIASRDVVLPEAASPLHLAVALSRAATLAELGRLRQGLAIGFVLLGVGLVAGVVLQVVVGLAPLRRIRRALAEVRAGEREALAMPAPAEIAPLVTEVDALIRQNRETVAMARTHLGNLAHALKTPIAVLRNALEATPPALPVARTEAAALDRLVQHHLARARSAALAAGAPEVAPMALAEEVARALRRLFPAIAIAVEGDAKARLRADAQDLTEMLGNLMENACQWAAGEVLVTVEPRAEAIGIAVEDDGPGLPAGGAAEALARGARLDEAKPGSGLGLAIVRDLAALAGGSLVLEAGAKGGLRALLLLPRRGAAATSGEAR
ncbi:HAMP domain-containing histidine kinase [Roseomonas stagni]|uniref:histidine kinase n=1 Tax=Falsiroseomonas algicola TaxID=2716930 RepID=A0A6M1LL68_9PROT|nr:HAMP domain-containing sensor histidine kinase [Falsiroseomonas algicola]NGM20739.1 HAMP domain-containing histidine kinase [Falsiroseomonas algicola]